MSVVSHTVTSHPDSCRFAWDASRRRPVIKCRHKTSKTITQTTPNADQRLLTLIQSVDSAARIITAPKTHHGEFNSSRRPKTEDFSNIFDFISKLRTLIQNLTKSLRWYPTTRDEWAYTGTTTSTGTGTGTSTTGSYAGGK